MYIGFLVTYKCPAECKHCLYQSSPRRNALIRLEDVRRDLLSLKSNWPIEAVCFVGGEPLLYLGLLTSLVREVKAQGVTCAILTNAFWGEDQSTAREYVGALKDSGLDEMHISVDAFHQEFVPLDAVKEVIRASKEAGIGHIAINAKSLGDPDMDNPYNRQTKRLMEELSEEFDFEGMRFAPLWIAGRAAYTLAEYLPATKMPEGRCHRRDGMDVVTDSMYVEIYPDGWIPMCPGIAIGNTNDASASDILRGYNPREHPILAPLLDKGVKGLLDLAVEKGYRPIEGYVHQCHVCFSARRFLRPLYPDILAPAHLYE